MLQITLSNLKITRLLTKINNSLKIKVKISNHSSNPNCPNLIQTITSIFRVRFILRQFIQTHLNKELFKLKKVLHQIKVEVTLSIK